VSSLGTEGGLIRDFQFGDASLRTLELRNAHLLHGKIRALRAERAAITAGRIDSVEFTGCDLSSLRWAGGKISRVRFDTCRLLGARLEGLTLEHAAQHPRGENEPAGTTPPGVMALPSIASKPFEGLRKQRVRLRDAVPGSAR
jgi:uncharacterized protein YjbI with pentapeptide repeats